MKKSSKSEAKYYALTIHQPWAELIVRRRKPFELGRRKFKHRGPLLIHASQKWDADDDEHMGVHRNKVPYGAFVGVSVIRDVRPLSKKDVAVLKKKNGGTASIGQVAWVLSSVHRLERPIRFPGRQSVFLPPAVAVRAAKKSISRAQSIAKKAVRNRG